MGDDGGEGGASEKRRSCTSWDAVAGNPTVSWAKKPHLCANDGTAATCRRSIALAICILNWMTNFCRKQVGRAASSGVLTVIILYY